MDENMEVAVTAMIIVSASLIHLKTRRSRRKRSCWVKEWLKRRENGRGMLNMVGMELRHEDPLAYKNFLRMSEENFNELLALIREDIAKCDTHMRESISAEHRLALTLRYLATGESFRSLMYSCRIHETTVSKIVTEVCDAIYKRLRCAYLRCPQTPQEWFNISLKFSELWNYPMCLGAIDGKHVVFRAPKKAGSTFYNYKGTHSLVLLAVVDAEYKFLYVDIGVNGRISDGGVFRQSSLYKSMSALNFPVSESLPGRSLKIPYHFVGDQAFALSERLMKPYPFRDICEKQQNFNHRLSRARRVVENAFGILANRWRILLSPMNVSPQKVESNILAVVSLHNFLASRNKIQYLDQSSDHTNSVLQGLTPGVGQRSNTNAQLVRRELTEFLWQDRRMN